MTILVGRHPRRLPELHDMAIYSLAQSPLLVTIRRIKKHKVGGKNFSHLNWIE